MFLFLVPVFVIFLYLYGTRTFDYWKKRGIKHEKPVPFLGTNTKQFLQRASMCMVATETYNKFPNEKVVGFFRGSDPELVIRDPEIAKRILITDFQHFHGRGLINAHKTAIEPLLKNLFFAEGDLWRLVRQRFTPAFSTAKLKAVFPLITERAEKLQILAEDISQQEFYNVRELMARYTTDFIGAYGFGIDMDSLSDENSQFRWLGKRIFYRSPKDALKGALKIMFPELCRNLTFLAPELEKSMVHLVTKIITERNYKPVGRNDFIDLFLELKQHGKLTGESIEFRNGDGTPKVVELEFTDMLLIAQVFVFFGAGFETSSTASSFTLHQLALSPDCQEKVQQEIDRVLEKHNNKITYDAVNEMKYLEMAFYEGMRMYPSVGYLMRKCTSPHYTFPELNLTIDQNVKVIIPIQAINRDAMYFDNPNKYDPERFREGTSVFNKFFMPFGEGPRACVGTCSRHSDCPAVLQKRALRAIQVKANQKYFIQSARLGQMQSMAGIAALLQKFTVEPAACTKVNPTPDPGGIVSEGFVGGLPLKIRKRNKTK